ncbi:hypothetical protein [Priestia aryabhattai]|uniref:hypothetical protein n=1 Tax=Priestia aryabhattai TaxID=412384 RepID=UPI003C90339E
MGHSIVEGYQPAKISFAVINEDGTHGPVQELGEPVTAEFSIEKSKECTEIYESFTTEHECELVLSDEQHEQALQSIKAFLDSPDSTVIGNTPLLERHFKSISMRKGMFDAIQNGRNKWIDELKPYLVN